MMKKLIMLAVLLILTGCAEDSSRQDPPISKGTTQELSTQGDLVTIDELTEAITVKSTESDTEHELLPTTETKGETPNSEIMTEGSTREEPNTEASSDIENTNVNTKSDEPELYDGYTKVQSFYRFICNDDKNYATVKSAVARYGLFCKADNGGSEWDTYLISDKDESVRVSFSDGYSDYVKPGWIYKYQNEIKVSQSAGL